MVAPDTSVDAWSRWFRHKAKEGGNRVVLLAALEAADPGCTSGYRPPAWDDARLAALEALGRRDEARAFRWERFKATLNAEHLRAYLSRLPAFDDVEAEEAALAHAESHASVHSALDFLVSWPALDRAARLVVARRDELDGDVFPILTPAAGALAEAHPLAATILLRAMIDFSLEHGKTTRYRHAARHLNDCAGLAARVSDFGDLADHASYLARVKSRHGRKLSFWRHVANEGGA